jgi:3-oxoadipate enol-lactonase/4-carboxymuconolactone decarboxylase
MMSVQLTWTDFGGADRPLLLLGPSIGNSLGTLWGAVAAQLADRFHVVGWDLPGHGRSAPAVGFSVADLAAAVLAESEEPFQYAGVSLGGAVGQQLLLDAPDRVVRATLFATGPRIGMPADWHARAARVRAEGTGWLVEPSRTRWFGPAHRDGAVADALLGELAAVDVASYAAVCDALAAFDVRDRLAEIAAPVLAVAGAHDPVTTVATLRHLADGVQHGRLVVLADAAHQAPAELPDQVAELIAQPVDESPPASLDQLRARGMQVRREVLGDAHVERASAGADDFTAEFQQFITTYAWGGVWTRPALDRRSRSFVTLTALVARGQYEELAMHVRAALRNGVTTDELKEVFLQAAVYCGVPAANAAFRVAQRVLGEDDPL